MHILHIDFYARLMIVLELLMIRTLKTVAVFDAANGLVVEEVPTVRVFTTKKALTGLHACLA